MKGKVDGLKWNKIFMEISGQCYMGFLPFSPVSLIESCSFWSGFKDLFTLHKLSDKDVLNHWNCWRPNG